MRPRKLGILCYPTLGGSARVATELARYWAHAGVEVQLLGYERAPGLDPAVHFRHVHVAEYPLFRYPPYDLALAAEIVELHESKGVACFHAHYALPHALALELADRMLGGGRLYWVTTLHGTDITLLGGHPAYRRALGYGLRASGAVTAVSRSLAEETQALLHLEREVRVVPNFVSVPELGRRVDPAWLSASGEQERCIVHVSTLRAVKRVLDLIDAFALLRQRLPVRLRIVGEGPQRSLSEARARELGLAPFIDFLGELKEPEQLLRDADLYCFSSRTESFGLGLLEAMAMGIPVLGPRVGGVPELLGPELSDWLVEPARPLALARAAESLLTDASAWRRASELGRARAREQFRIEAAIAGYEAAFAEAKVQSGFSGGRL
ncbi:MAG: N-acetyl-alpha-D-glucosaminyl L-malate synthase BshA [Planctomycetota bacterium]|nr:MAG: N-acetyl-alpha-D-glucosaminyl L-malate synthase BshA [Planctomycetota bacterium]